jgi:hypothetical protein
MYSNEGNHNYVNIPNNVSQIQQRQLPATAIAPSALYANIPASATGSANIYSRPNSTTSFAEIQQAKQKQQQLEQQQPQLDSSSNSDNTHHYQRQNINSQNNSRIQASSPLQQPQTTTTTSTTSTTTTPPTTIMPTTFWDQWINKLQNDFLETQQTSVCVWGCAQTINFLFLPTHTRVLFTSFVSVFWSAYLSFIGHRDAHDDDDGRNNHEKLRMEQKSRK